MLTDDYRQGFIAGAITRTDLEHARWAIRHDMDAARDLRDTARETGDEVFWKNVRYFVAEARMWSEIARLLLRQERGEWW